MNSPIDPRLLGVVERVSVPVVLLAVLGTIGFFGTASVTPLPDTFWFMYAGMWILGLAFIVWYVRRPSQDMVAEKIDPVAVLQARYAAGEIDQETFEQQLDTLLDGGESLVLRRAEQILEAEGKYI